MNLPRVTDIERIIVRVPFRESIALWQTISANHCQVVEVIRLTTDDPEIVGYGETLVHYIATRDVVTDATVARVLGSRLTDHISDDTIGAGLQMALYDAYGKAVGQPMSRLLGKPVVRGWAPVSWWTMEAPPEVLAEEAALAVEWGYLSHKIKARPWFDLDEQVAAIAARTPESFAIDIDWNSTLGHSSTALPVLDRLADEPRVGLFEDPVPKEDVAGQAALRAHARRPVASHFREELFAPQLAANALDGYVVDGGVHRGLAIGTTLASVGKNLFLQYCGTGITMAMSLHVAAVLPPARWPAVSMTTSFQEDLLATPIPVQGGFARIPDGPGLGVEVDEEALTRLRVPTAAIPELADRIYSVDLGSGRTLHVATVDQLWGAFDHRGAFPVTERGARLSVRVDDGSADFRDLRARALTAPVWDVSA